MDDNLDWLAVVSSHVKLLTPGWAAATSIAIGNGSADSIFGEERFACLVEGADDALELFQS
jgi:hypothetical protein